MKRLLLLIVIFVSQPALGAAPRFASTADGDVAVDLELDLTQLPSFNWASDPFLKTSGLGRAANSEREEIEYKLQATTFEGEDSVAVVNDRVVRVGDRVGARTVLKIGADFVLLGEKGSVIEATLEAHKAPEAARAPASVGASAAGSGLRPKLPEGPANAAAMLDQALGKAPEGKISIEEVKK